MESEQVHTPCGSEPLRVIRTTLLFGVLALLLAPGTATARRAHTPAAFEHLQSAWNGVVDYTMTIEAHEVLGEDSADSELHYAFKRPNRARLDVLKGLQSGSTMVLDDSGDTVTAYMRAFPVFKKHGGAHDKDLTSLRGNGILMPNVANLIACYAGHRDELRQIEGPVVDGHATDEVELPYANVTCTADADGDRGVVTLDVIDIARDTGYIVMRKRYVGNEIVERWEITDYKINSGLGDDDLD
jgi:hypothetical protein